MCHEYILCCVYFTIIIIHINILLDMALYYKKYIMITARLDNIKTLLI